MWSALFQTVWFFLHFEQKSRDKISAQQPIARGASHGLYFFLSLGKVPQKYSSDDVCKTESPFHRPLCQSHFTSAIEFEAKCWTETITLPPDLELPHNVFPIPAGTRCVLVHSTPRGGGAREANHSTRWYSYKIPTVNRDLCDGEWRYNVDISIFVL